MKFKKYELEPRELGPILAPPEKNSFFTWPWRSRWHLRDRPQHPQGMIRASLQSHGWTSTFYPFGFIIEIEQGGVKRGWSQPVSDYLSIGNPPIAEVPSGREFTIYQESEMKELLLATPSFDSNELWVDGSKARVVAAYASNIDGEKKVQQSKIFYMVMKKIQFPLCLL